MRNNKLTASYMKDIVDYMKKYHLTSVTISDTLKLFRMPKGSSDFLHFVDMGEANDTYNDLDVFGINLKEFIENFKNSKYYQKEIYKGDE